MAIEYSIAVEGDTLLVDAWGFDESLTQVQEYGMALIAACVRYGVTRLLCNELRLEYRLGVVDTYRAAEFIAAEAPAVAWVAIVCDPKQVADACFFEDVAVNRGLTVRVFTELDAATDWLKQILARVRGLTWCQPGNDLPHRPELLSPAGDLKALRHALAFGADAVYAGLPRYSLRVRNNAFDAEALAVGIAEAHALGRRLYLAVNLMPHGAKIRTFVADMEPILALGPDALIMADPGLILLVRERWPEVPIHLSVQANTVNAEAVRFWAGQGIARVILSRELSLEEIAEIRAACPDTELEVFVHGALCIAYSGRCLLSGYFNHRDANQGACTNACRWEYRLGDSVPAAGPESPGEAQDGRHPQAD